MSASKVTGRYASRIAAVLTAATLAMFGSGLSVASAEASLATVMHVDYVHTDGSALTADQIASVVAQVPVSRGAGDWIGREIANSQGHLAIADTRRAASGDSETSIWEATVDAQTGQFLLRFAMKSAASIRDGIESVISIDRLGGESARSEEAIQTGSCTSCALAIAGANVATAAYCAATGEAGPVGWAACGVFAGGAETAASHECSTCGSQNPDPNCSIVSANYRRSATSGTSISQVTCSTAFSSLSVTDHVYLNGRAWANDSNTCYNIEKCFEEHDYWNLSKTDCVNNSGSYSGVWRDPYSGRTVNYSGSSPRTETVCGEAATLLGLLGIS